MKVVVIQSSRLPPPPSVHHVASAWITHRGFVYLVMHGLLYYRSPWVIYLKQKGRWPFEDREKSRGWSSEVCRRGAVDLKIESRITHNCFQCSYIRLHDVCVSKHAGFKDIRTGTRNTGPKQPGTGNTGSKYSREQGTLGQNTAGNSREQGTLGQNTAGNREQ